jgi:hypothetical protein
VLAWSFNVSYRAVFTYALDTKPPEQASPGPYYDEGLPLVRVEGRYVVAAPVTFPQHWKFYGH